MAYYNYKRVRDQLPDWIITAQGKAYDGDGNYDGHQWIAAADYIDFLEKRIKSLGADLEPTEQDILNIEPIHSW